MPESTLRASLVPLGLPSSPIAGAPSGTILSFTVQHQQQTEWCWAAVSASVAAYYNPQTSWTQCSVANATLGQTTCCQDGSTSQCNVPWALDEALTTVGDFGQLLNQGIPLNQVSTEIDGGRPVGARVAWSGGAGAHFVAVGGYSQQGVLDIQDPWFGPSSIPYSTFTTGYLGSGTWTNSYLTVPPSGQATVPPGSGSSSSGSSGDPWTPQNPWGTSTSPSGPTTGPVTPPSSPSPDPWASQVPGWGPSTSP